MNSEALPLIVGAGPVGLAAALFLARQGNAVRIVEELAEPSKESRALTINPRTLEMLEPTGITRQMLELGKRIHGVWFHRGSQRITLPLAGIHSQYPFMLALSQASAERLLTRAVQNSGVTIERRVKLIGCTPSDGEIVALLESVETGARESVVCPWLLAADGAHSTVRDKSSVEFPGSSLPDEWYLADAPINTQLPPDYGHVFLDDSGTFIFMLRVVDERLERNPGDHIWRIISNRAAPLRNLPQARQTAPAVWESTFSISHRMVASMAVGNVYFAGDAAHIHSPIGARGMNLGIEDAWVFAELVKRGRLGEYNDLRRPVDKKVVRRVEMLTRLIAAQSPFTKLLRQHALPATVKSPLVRSRLLAAVTGLDHDLPEALVG